MGAFGNPGSRDSHVRKSKKSTKQKKEELKLKRRRKRELENVASRACATANLAP